MEALLEQLKAVAEPTRLRIVVALESCELTVSEICQVLGQTQPRVSRHLRLLTDAGLLQRHAEGTSAYFGLRAHPDSKDLLAAIAPLIDRNSPVLGRDQARLESVRSERAERAAEYFALVADEWDELREMHAPTAVVEEAMLAAVTSPTVQTVLDIGTGTGRVLELFADRTERGLGVDLSRQMLGVARARLDDDRFGHCSVRHADIYDLDVSSGSQDVVILHHVLHYLSDPASALAVADRVLAPGGTLLVVDFATHGLDRLRVEHAHSHLGFADAEITAWCASLGLEASTARHFLPPPDSGDESLTVSLWVATKPVTGQSNSVPASEFEVSR
jgi:ubiquinone/menaquinone biosynthesis C-methylase UbiE/DNA-binding transcriptional ArsR family regulator